MENSLQKRILLVDDEPEILEFLKDLVEDFDLEACTFENGEEAWKAFENRPFDLIISDQNIPGMTGTELAHKIFSIHPQAHFYLFTGEVDGLSKEVEDLDSNFFKGVLSKPLSFEDISMAIEKSLLQLQTPSNKPDEGSKEKARSPRILIVDDEPHIVDFMTTILEDLEPNIEVESYGNGQLALEAFLKNPFDIIITDIQMPVMDGLQMIQKINSTTHDPDIFIVTAAAGSSREKLANQIKKEVKGYYDKPISMREFLDDIKSSLEAVAK